MDAPPGRGARALARAAAAAAAVLCGALLASCVRQLPAPVQDRSTTEGVHWETYTVRDDDTLYSIAWRHELDYKALAEANGIEPPYIIRPGQRLALVGGQLRGAGPEPEGPSPESPSPESPPPAAPTAAAQPEPSELASPAWQTLPAVAAAAGAAAEAASQASRATVRAAPKPAAPTPRPKPPVAAKPSAAATAKPSTTSANPKATPPAPKPAAAAPRAAPPKPQAPARKVDAAPGWRQPVASAPKRGFGGASKGYDYDLPPATPVFAVHDGEVAYAGPGIGGFRHTFIVKIGDRYLVAYSLNAEPRPKEGDTISAGDVVASIGSGGANAGRLHFEIRERGQAVDPAPLIGQ